MGTVGSSRAVGVVTTTSLALVLALPILSSAAAPTPEAIASHVEITAADGGPEDSFGSAVDVDAGTLVSGAACDTTVGGNCDGSA